MAVYVVGVVGILVFYVAVLGVGIWAARKAKNTGEEEVMLAGRNLGLVVGLFTAIATWVGGGYINGAAEVMYTRGLVWCQVPIGYSLSLFFGVFLFVRQMRERNCVTMLDPFQKAYGNRVGGLMYLPALCGDLFWVGAILNALGSSLVVILELEPTTSIVVSAVFAAAYTTVGGLYSVSYTDILQLVCITFGLILSAPFAYHHTAVDHDVLAKTDWFGILERKDVGEWIDGILLLIFGGIPWQGYFQRILSMRTTRQAQVLSITATFGCAALSIPPAIFGVVARAVDWNSVEGFEREVTEDQAEIILPLSLRYLTPAWVSFFGLGAISAAVMSSADSSILASSSMFTRNIYKLAFRPKASEKEVLWALRISVVVITALSTVISLTVGSVYYLSYLCSDLVYVILFPQLLLVIHWSKGVNTYGCIASFCVGMLVRLLGGEPGLGLPPTIRYPWFDEENNAQKFPFRTFTMLVALFTHIIVSVCTRKLFASGILPERWDVLGAEAPREAETEVVPEQRYRSKDDSAQIVPDDQLPTKMAYSNPALTEEENPDERRDSKF